MLIKEVRETLKTGGILTVKVLESPLEEYVEKLEDYTKSKMPYAPDNEKRFRGRLTKECKDMFFIGEINNEIVSLMWYTISEDVGTYGMVSTKEEYRRKGISNCLMKHCLKFMDKERNLLAMYLGVTNPIAKKIYEKYGWVSYNDCPNTCIMRRLKKNINQENFDKEYYRIDRKIRIRGVKRGDLPKIEALYNWTGNKQLIKNYLSHIFNNTAVEGQIISLNNKVENNEGKFLCIENSLNHIVGIATLFDSNLNYQTHLKVLDFLVHPNYWDYTMKLLDSIIVEDEKRTKKEIISYLASCDKEKINWLKELGFKERGIIRDYFRREEEKVNLLIFSKEV
ncbi:MAG: GNAT family N-acetyltransferase [bacterium]